MNNILKYRNKLNFAKTSIDIYLILLSVLNLEQFLTFY